LSKIPERITVAAPYIIITMVIVLFGGMAVDHLVKENERATKRLAIKKENPIVTSSAYFVTAKHDGHLFIGTNRLVGYFMHHPDCCKKGANDE